MSITRFFFIMFKSLRKIGYLSKVPLLARISHYLCIRLIKYKVREIDISNYESSSHSKNTIPKIIWVFWYQGMESRPEVVMKCHNELLLNTSSDYTVNFIDQYNIEDYFSIPQLIKEKLSSGAITLTHFSDILRFYLLFKYGGYWIDSTVLVLDDLDSILQKEDFFSLKHRKYSVYHSPTKGLWTSYCIGLPKESPLAKYMLDSFLAYWGKNNSLIDYHLVDYLLALAYNYSPSLRNTIDTQEKYIGDDRWLLHDNFNKSINYEFDKKISCCQYKIFKLSYKLTPPDDKDTYYFKYFVE